MKDYDTSHLKELLSDMKLSLSEQQLSQLLTFYELLVDKNKVMNLTAITEFEEVMEKHFADSLSLVRVVDLDRSLRVIDLGTGAGFPGIPLKIAFPKLQVTLADSVQKRLSFLDEVTAALGLEGIRTVHARAEDLGHMPEYRQSFDLCVSRAVANLSTLSEYCLPLVRIGGQFISYKSGDCEAEAEAAKSALFLMGGKLAALHKFTLGDAGRAFVVIDKTAGTPKKYPRKAGIPSKNPL